MTKKDTRNKRLLMRIRAFNFGVRALHLIAKDKWTFPYIIKKMRPKVVPFFYVEFDESDWENFHDKFGDSPKRRNIKAA